MFSRVYTRGLCLAFIVGLGLPFSAFAGGPVVMKEYPVTDPGMNNTVAYTLLVPKGWTVKGGLKRPVAQLYMMPVLNDVAISAPDGRQVHLFPSMSFEFNRQAPGQSLQPTLGGNLYLDMPQSPGRWLMEMAQRSPDPTVADLALVSEEDVPELTQALRQQNAAMFQSVQMLNQNGAALGMAYKYDTQATLVKLQYTQNNLPLEESVLITWNCFITGMQGQAVSGNWGIPLMISLRGPIGTDYMHDPVLNAITQAVRINPAWQQEMTKYWQEIARIQQRGAQQRQNDWARHNQKMNQINNDISDIITKGYAQRQAMQDAGHERATDAILDQTPYTTPDGQTVKLPSFYDHVYTDGNGTYLLNNDANYQPNTDPTVNSVDWQRIEPRE
ncbi:MAG: hypothetical protein GC164_03510 [Phycisphaera sp.]|nr:hypothetical protein [Phycisphaera sp.]